MKLHCSIPESNFNRRVNRSIVPARAVFGLAALLLFSTGGFAPRIDAAQLSEAMLRGRVSNIVTGKNLTGASVQIAGTNRIEHTDPDGTYELRHLPVGAISVTVTYPGLDSMTVAVDLRAGATTVQNFQLTSGIYVMQEFAVAGMREGNAAAISRQEQAISVVNVVSADAFGTIAKGNIGSFLQRVPGVAVTTGEVDIENIVLRGMAPDFTVINIDGTAAASAFEGRSQVVGGIPSDFIESVELVKTPTADMSADSLGGTINLKTKSAFNRAGRVLSITAAVVYNETFGKKADPTHGEYLFPSFTLQYSDVFGVLGGKNNLGIVFSGNSEVFGLVRSTIFAEFQPNWDYKSPSRPRRLRYTSHQFHRQERSGANARFDYKLSENSKIVFAAGFTRYVENMERIQPTFEDNVVVNFAKSTEDLWVFDRARYRAVRDLRYRPTETWRWNLQGDHELFGWRAHWDLTYSKSERYDIRRGISALTQDDIAFTWDRTNREFPTLTQTGGRSYTTNNFNNAQVDVSGEHRYTTNEKTGVRIDLKRRLEAGPLAATLKTGFQFRGDLRVEDRDRSNGGRAVGSNFSAYVDQNFTFDWAGGRYPHSNILDTARFHQDAGYTYLPGGVAGRPALKFAFNPAFATVNVVNTVRDVLRDDFRAKETIPAGYLQVESRLVPQLRMTAGVRYEETDVAVRTASDIAAAATPEVRYGSYQNLKSGYKNWFPNLQFRYEPMKRILLRAAFSTTIGRPGIGDITESFVQDDSNHSIAFANPALKPQHSQNYDLSAEYFFEPVGVVSVGVFRKSITDFVTPISFSIETGREMGLDLQDYVGWLGTTKANSGSARVEGVEFNYMQHFTFLPGLLKGFGAFFNWTALSTRGDYGTLGNVKLPFKNALVAFVPQSGNAGLSYTYGRWDLRLQWNFADTFLSSLSTTDPSNSGFFGRRTQWDAFAKLRLTRRLQFFADAVNIGPSNRSNYRGRATEDRRSQTHHWATVVTAGLRADF